MNHETFKSLRWCRNVLDVLAASRKPNSRDRMTFLATAVAMDWACFADKDGLLFRAASDTARAIGAAESNVRDAAEMLVRYGLAEVPEDVKKQTGKKKKGRDAKTYRLLMVDVSRLHRGGNDNAFSSPVQAENQTTVSAPVGAPFSAPMGATTVGRTDKGAGALGARPAPTSDQGCSAVIEVDHHLDTDATCGLTALEAPTPASSDRASEIEMDARPFAGEPDTFADLLPDGAADGSGRDTEYGEPITLVDLDRLVAAERGDDMRAFAIDAADRLAALHGPSFPADEFVKAFTAGFIGGDFAARDLAARWTAQLIIAMPKDSARGAWSDHCAALLSLLHRIPHGEGDTLDRYIEEVGIAGQKMVKQRRKSHSVEAEMKGIENA